MPCLGRAAARSWGEPQAETGEGRAAQPNCHQKPPKIMWFYWKTSLTIQVWSCYTWIYDSLWWSIIINVDLGGSRCIFGQLAQHQGCSPPGDLDHSEVQPRDRPQACDTQSPGCCLSRGRMTLQVGNQRTANFGVTDCFHLIIAQLKHSQKPFHGFSWVFSPIEGTI